MRGACPEAGWVVAMSAQSDIAARSQPFVVARQPDDSEEFNDEENQ